MDIKVSPQLAAIANWNPGISLSDDDVKKANAGQLILVGLGSIVPVGPGGRIAPGGQGPTSPPTPIGCIEYMRYHKGSNDLTQIRIDGNWYAGGNLKEFREVLEKAAFHMKCINFCWDSSTNTMTMLNVYPQCCCRCEEAKD